MHELDARVDEVLTHYGIKGMRWGVIRDRDQPGGADGKSEKAKKAVKKHGLSKIKQGRILRERLDFDRVDMKTGEYTNTGKVAKTARIIDRTLDVAKGLTIIGGAVVAVAAGAS